MNQTADIVIATFSLKIETRIFDVITRVPQDDREQQTEDTSR